jgi:hypothetical protein
MRILFTGLCLMVLTLMGCGCTCNTEIFVYQNGLEKKIARVKQEDDGIASYAVKDKYTITVDTRYKANTDTDPVIEVIQRTTEKKK